MMRIVGDDARKRYIYLRAYTRGCGVNLLVALQNCYEKDRTAQFLDTSLQYPFSQRKTYGCTLRSLLSFFLVVIDTNQVVSVQAALDRSPTYRFTIEQLKR